MFQLNHYGLNYWVVVRILSLIDVSSIDFSFGSIFDRQHFHCSNKRNLTILAWGDVDLVDSVDSVQRGPAVLYSANISPIRLSISRPLK